MDRNQIHSEVAIPIGGFEWTSARPAEFRGPVDLYQESEDPRRSEPYETVLVPSRPTEGWKVYDPIRASSGLFLEFAELDPSEESILAFANRYGSLGHGGICRLKVPRKGDTRMIVTGWPLSGWQEQIKTMRELVSLWNKVKSGDLSTTVPATRWGTIVGQDPLPVDPRAQAFQTINQKLNVELSSGIYPETIFNPAEGKDLLRLVAKTLRGVLWLQLALAVSGDREYRQCKECGKWFEVSLEAARTSRVFCSDACKSKSYRDRKERAQKLHRKGKSIKEIAREIGSDLTTVKKWVSRTKG